MRRRRDLNSRTSYLVATFPRWCTRPLCDASALKKINYWDWICTYSGTRRQIRHNQWCTRSRIFFFAKKVLDPATTGVLPSLIARRSRDLGRSARLPPALIPTGSFLLKSPVGTTQSPSLPPSLDCSMCSQSSSTYSQINTMRRLRVDVLYQKWRGFAH